MYEFLDDLYRPDEPGSVWLAPVWEYSYTHAAFDADNAGRMAIWEQDGTIVAAVLYELFPEEAFLFAAPNARNLYPEMILHAEGELAVREENGRKRLTLFIPERDDALERAARDRGFAPANDGHRPMAALDLQQMPEQRALPDGFRLVGLDEDNDLAKVDMALWRGFGHEGDPPVSGIVGRRKMQSGPHYRHDLNLVAVAPDGRFVAYGGTWLNPRHRYGYVEPVATDPDFRRLGLGRAVVVEGMRRCRRAGCEVVYVASDLPFYHTLGFRQITAERRFTRTLT